MKSCTQLPGATWRTDLLTFVVGTLEPETAFQGGARGTYLRALPGQAPTAHREGSSTSKGSVRCGGPTPGDGNVVRVDLGRLDDLMQK